MLDALFCSTGRRSPSFICHLDEGVKRFLILCRKSLVLLQFNFVVKTTVTVQQSPSSVVRPPGFEKIISVMVKTIKSFKLCLELQNRVADRQNKYAPANHSA